MIPDELYTAAGAKIGDPWTADVVVKVAPPSTEEIARISTGAKLIGFLNHGVMQDNRIAELKAAGIEGYAVEAIPRISRAQVMDALSSQANVSGYKAVLLAASESTRFSSRCSPPAAGTVKPATVSGPRSGCGRSAGRWRQPSVSVAALPGTTCVLRSPTRCVRVGAQWLDLGIDAAGEGGYARELTDDERAKQQQALEDAIKGFDVVITTALVPGRPAPRLVTAAAVEGMKPGSVVVDLAGETGGNCELTEPGQTVVKHGVTICSPLNLPASIAGACVPSVYSKNISALIELMLVEGALAPDFSDEVLAGACVTREEKGA